MHLLCIDTATAQVSVAIGTDGVVVGEIALASGRRHAEHLAPAIQYLTREVGVPLSALSAIGVGVGPGLFTGLRVGITTAKILAQAQRVPVVAIPSLDLIAYPFRHARRLVVVAVDARRREVFHAFYRPVPGGLQRDGEYGVGTPEDLAAELAARGEEALLVGDGAVVHRARFEGLDRVELVGPGNAAPSAGALVELGTARFEREEFSQPWDVQPLYLRKSDAELEADHGGP